MSRLMVKSGRGRESIQSFLFRVHHLPALIYGLFCGNKKYLPPRKNPVEST